MKKPDKRMHDPSWTQNEAKRIFMKKTMNLYHWTQPTMPSDYIRKIISHSWDIMTDQEKQVYEKQVSIKSLRSTCLHYL